MNTIRPCGCKGVRSCLQCENEYNLQKPPFQNQVKRFEALSYCPKCECIYDGWNTQEIQLQHKTHKNGQPFKGIFIKENFLENDEGNNLMCELDKLPWTISQSGRRKQNFGPKTNFKRKKLKNGSFIGFPEFSKFVQTRFKEIELLRDFQTIEQCSLEYDQKKGSSIDPHIDDCWIWGERVVTVNCLGDTVLTLTVYDDNQSRIKYNLDVMGQYADSLLAPLLGEDVISKFNKKVIRVPMPNNSLIVLYGPARYQFEHCVLREDIIGRRVCLAYREFTPMYISGELKDEGEIIRENASHFWHSIK